jgi:hypothetical protein
MKTELALAITATAVGGLMLASCGGEQSASVPPPGPPVVVTENLDTAEVLAIAQTKTSETSSPFAVDGAAVLVTPADDETGTPIPVDGS